MKTEKPLFPEPAPGTGQEKDKETATTSDPTGEMHYRARAYSPRQMRFVQQDPPVGRRPEVHYAYADDRPVSMVDVTGATGADIARIADEGGGVGRLDELRNIGRNRNIDRERSWGSTASLAHLEGMDPRIGLRDAELVEYDALLAASRATPADNRLLTPGEIGVAASLGAAKAFVSGAVQFPYYGASYVLNELESDVLPDLTGYMSKGIWREEAREFSGMMEGAIDSIINPDKRIMAAAESAAHGRTQGVEDLGATWAGYYGGARGGGALAKGAVVGLMRRFGSTTVVEAPAPVASETMSVPASRPTLPFKSGDIVLRQYPTPRGVLELLAEVQIEGSTLHLKDVAIYMKGAGGHVPLGIRDVLRTRAQLAAEAKELGFSKVRVTGTRAENSSSANKGHSVDVTIDVDK